MGSRHSFVSVFLLLSHTPSLTHSLNQRKTCPIRPQDGLQPKRCIFLGPFPVCPTKTTDSRYKYSQSMYEMSSLETAERIWRDKNSTGVYSPFLGIVGGCLCVVLGKTTLPWAVVGLVLRSHLRFLWWMDGAHPPIKNTIHNSITT